MSWRYPAAALAGLVVVGCGGNPFPNAPAAPVVTPPVAVVPSAATPISRTEVETADGNGYAQNITYNPLDNTYSVDNLGFDGDNAYTELLLPRTGPVFGTRLGQYRVYESKLFQTDPTNGAVIGQFQHRILEGISATGTTAFALVRTGSYTNYGFGGFVLKRNVAVSLPTSGQAAYRGNYAGLRDFESRAGMEQTAGDMQIDIDFSDFNAGNAVKGTITNRRVYDLSGTDITRSILDAWAADPSVAQSVLPTLVFSVGPGVMDASGQLTGNLKSNISNADGTVQVFEDGNYYAIVAGPNSEEIVGVIVVESADPRSTTGNVRETGGFILYRNP